MKNYINALVVVMLFLIVLNICANAHAKEENYMSSDEKMFSMMFDIHSEMMGYDRTENICGFGTSLKEMNYAIFKGKKYHADDNGFIVINTNEPR